LPEKEGEEDMVADYGLEIVEENGEEDVMENEEEEEEMK